MVFLRRLCLIHPAAGGSAPVLRPPPIPALWAPGNPVLYGIERAVGGDRVSDRAGFRTIERRGTDILLNGQPVFLRGISVHENDETLGKAATEEDLRRRFRHAKELGCNDLRLAHYPHHERAAQPAGELGLMLWEDVPVCWAVGFAGPATRQDAESQLRELIRRDRNRASLIIWPVGSENPDTGARLAVMRGPAHLGGLPGESRQTEDRGPAGPAYRCHRAQ